MLLVCSAVFPLRMLMNSWCRSIYLVRYCCLPHWFLVKVRELVPNTDRSRVMIALAAPRAVLDIRGLPPEATPLRLLSRLVQSAEARR